MIDCLLLSTHDPSISLGMGGGYPRTVFSVPANGENRDKFDVHDLSSFKVEFTQSASPATEWAVEVNVVVRGVAVQV